MDVTIKTKASTPLEQMAIKKSLETLAQNVTKENLSFLAELSKKPDINRKLESNKTKINIFI